MLQLCDTFRLCLRILGNDDRVIVFTSFEGKTLSDSLLPLNIFFLNDYNI